MHNLEIASVLFWLLGTVVGVAAIYYSFGIAREWLGKENYIDKGKSSGRATLPGSSLDGHIATQWTEGRLRLDSLLAVINKHLRDECRMLVPLLQFCAHDLVESQGLDMTQKLSVLAEIQAAIESVDHD
jgi:hypothetical protein